MNNSTERRASGEVSMMDAELILCSPDFQVRRESRAADDEDRKMVMHCDFDYFGNQVENRGGLSFTRLATCTWYF